MAQMPPASSTMTLGRYTPEAKSLVAGAQSIADERHHAQVTPLHLLGQFLERVDTFVELLRAAQIDVMALTTATTQRLAAMPTASEPSYLSTAMIDLLKRTEQRADLMRSEQVELEHLLHSLTQEIRGPAGDVLTASGIFPGSLEPHYGVLRRTKLLPAGQNPGTNNPATLIDWVERARKGQLEPTVGR
ncbi:MAG TPA: Clp protease N-terminal domain-containing protein, partial [Polyangiaceae bacterium]